MCTAVGYQVQAEALTFLVFFFFFSRGMFDVRRRRRFFFFFVFAGCDGWVGGGKLGCLVRCRHLLGPHCVLLPGDFFFFYRIVFDCIVVSYGMHCSICFFI